ncbi:MAG: ferritin-like domain-containing protein, partial [Nannocystaceae bacterium]
MHRVTGQLHYSLALALGLLVVPSCGKTPEQITEEVCPDPQPVEVDGQPSGFVTCNGVTVREEPVQCNLPAQDDEVCQINPNIEGTPSTCMIDADCTDKANGYCSLTVDFGENSCGCNYACASDADCDTGEICDCGALRGDASKSRCVPAECDSTASCDGYGCVAYDASPYCGEIKIACQTPEDECQNDDDCDDIGFCIKSEGAFRCIPGECAIGRPFLVAGEARVAPVSRTAAGWHQHGESPEVDHLTPEQCQVLAAQWTRAAQLEHASIAAFARFTGQLMALGAPCSLIEASRQAMADELRHAQVCWHLAQVYGGQPVAPGRLELAGAVRPANAREVLQAVVDEGCIGETVAAAEAARLAAEVSDPFLKSVLETIARDETRHAALAWRFVAWAMQTPELATAARQALENMQVHKTAPSPMAISAEDRAWMRHGYLTEHAARQVR